LTGEESILRRWKEYFEELMNVENIRERRLEETEVGNQDVQDKQRGGEEGYEKYDRR